MADLRARVWAFIAYPESMPGDWLDILTDYHVPMAMSPLHDLDLDENMQLKKEHYHILIAFDGKKSYEQVKTISDSIHAAFPIRVESSQGYYRYLCHLDNPDKAQYDLRDILLISGFNPKNYIEEQAALYCEQMTEFIKTKDVQSFDLFVEYCLQNHRDDWFHLLYGRYGSFFKSYISARYNRLHPKKIKESDIE